MEQQECDEAQSLQAPDGINLNSHLDVFYAILRQVSVQQDVCVILVIATGIVVGYEHARESFIYVIEFHQVTFLNFLL